MKITLGVEAWEHTPELSVEELVQRLTRNFPSAVIDRERGNSHVQEGLNRLVAMGAPNIIIESHRSYFGNTVFVSVSESRWAGATANSYLQRMWPQLGDAVFFDVQGANDALLPSIARELAAALGMVVSSEISKNDSGSAGAVVDDSPWTREELQALAWERVKNEDLDEYDKLPGTP